MGVEGELRAATLAYLAACREAERPARGAALWAAWDARAEAAGCMVRAVLACALAVGPRRVLAIQRECGYGGEHG